jgi:hypothetical protein
MAGWTGPLSQIYLLSIKNVSFVVVRCNDELPLIIMTAGGS